MSSSGTLKSKADGHHNSKPLIKIPYRSPDSPILRYDEAVELVQQSKPIFASEPSLLEVKGNVIIVGDIHGQYEDLERILALNRDKDSAAHGINKFLFLGDYVDRGVNSYNTVNLLLRLKCRYPKQISLLRGNHETENINNCYGFGQEMRETFPHRNEGNALWKAFNDMFAYLPVAALVNKRILCMHGGISGNLKSLDDIRNVRRPIHDVMKDSVVGDLLWSDPVPGMKGYYPNKVRGVSVVFGEEEVTETCRRLNLDCIVRAHQVMYNGYSLFCNRKLITIFSAPRYCPERNSKAAVMVVKNKKISFVLIAPVTAALSGASMFRKNFTMLEYEQMEVGADPNGNSDESEPTRGSKSDTERNGK